MLTIQKQKNVLLVGTALLLFSVGYRLLPVIKESFSDTNNQFTEKRIEKLQKKVVYKKKLSERYRVLQQRLAQKEALLLRGSTPALAAVELQNLIYDLTRKYGASIQSVRVLTPSKKEDDTLSQYTTIAIQAHMEVSVRQLRNILYGLAKSPKLVAVDIMTLQRKNKKKDGTIKALLQLTGIMEEN